MCVSLLLASGCGASQDAPARLGVQSNEVPAQAVVLRVQPTVGARYRTVTQATVDANILSQQLRISFEFRDERTVIERRPDDTTVMSAQPTGGWHRTDVGETRGQETNFSRSDVPRTSVLDARGRTIDDGVFGPSLPESGSNGALHAILDAVLDGLVYPEEALSPNVPWESTGTRTFAGDGSLRHDITQSLVRVEGSGEGATAVIAFRGQLRGTSPGMGSGLARFDGVYTVALRDGLVRDMRCQIQGQLVIPRQSELDVTLSGELRYSAQ